jgi:hypothetical protein
MLREAKRVVVVLAGNRVGFTKVEAKRLMHSGEFKKRFSVYLDGDVLVLEPRS